ncbi:NFACT family protein [Candidatus Woesearchaeota archaeon]|nr:NFACT family protein [Candidatus Woesearchaeota archaeon]
MALKALSSVDIATIVQELQFLVQGKLPQVYHQEELLLQFHVAGKGKQLLRILPGKFLCLTAKKETVERQSGFCLLLRKYLDNATVKAIYQKDSERIVVLELQKEQKYNLIIELFSKGNIILADEQWTILGALQEQVWKDRSVKIKEKYVFPKSVNWKTITVKELTALIRKSDKKNIATMLATDLGLGGTFAEELLRRADLDKNMLPAEIKGAKKIFMELKKLREQLKSPPGYVYAESISPIPLSTPPLRTTATLSEAVDGFYARIKVSPYDKKIKSLHHMLEQQLQASRHQEQEIEENTKKAGKIYEHYASLQKLLETVQEWRKTKKWDEIAQELKEIKKLKNIDLAHKKITLDL